MDKMRTKTDKRTIEYVGTSSLTPYARNSRTHSPQQVKQIAASIKEFGFTNPVLIDESNGIVAGHGRVMAAEHLQLAEVPCIRLSYLTETQKRAYVIADNKLALNAEWDEELLNIELTDLHDEGFDVGMIGFEADELSDLMGYNDKEVVEDEVPEPPAEPITKHGDLWVLGEHRLLCGDSTKVEDVDRLMAGHQAQCVFTSPPYGVGIDYGDTYIDSIENLRAMLPKLAAIWMSNVVAGGFAVVNFGDIVSGRVAAATESVCEYPMALEYWPAFRSAGWTLWSRRVWCKPVAKVAAPWCASSNRSATNFEHVWTWKRDGVSIVGRVPQPFDSQTGWFDTSRMEGVDVGKETHGAGMPTSCAAWMLNVHSLRGGLVLEPFCGTGTTLIAAEQLGRKCYGMEISPQYCDVIVKRWETLTGKKAVLANG